MISIKFLEVSTFSWFRKEDSDWLGHNSPTEFDSFWLSYFSRKWNFLQSLVFKISALTHMKKEKTENNNERIAWKYGGYWKENNSIWNLFFIFLSRKIRLWSGFNRQFLPITTFKQKNEKKVTKFPCWSKFFQVIFSVLEKNTLLKKNY